MSDIQRVAKHDPSVDSLPIAPENPHANEASPSIPHRVPGRGAGSRVTVGYFDREGVDQLRRTLTHVSEAGQDPALNALSSETLSVPHTGPFDFEKTLRVIMKKCVVVLPHRRRSVQSGSVGATVPVFSHASLVSCSKISMLLAWALLRVIRAPLVRSSTPGTFLTTSEQCATLRCVTF
jgi:hypothetical protein